MRMTCENRRNVMPFNTYTIYKAAIVLIALAGISMPLQAEETVFSRTSKSISYTGEVELDVTVRKTELDNAEADILDALKKEGFRPESAAFSVYVENISYDYASDITIYDASTTLISDFDADGFYHRFSVAIDADTVYSTSWVYAKLYLSYEGGPWNYYASSDDFHIHGDSELDIYVVETELAEGFPAGYYDIRIELYDAENGDWLLSYGPYDDDSLSTLPLEDSVYDDVYYSSGYTTEVIVAGHGGVSIWLLAMSGFIGVMRLLARKHEA
jgi:hypothetical protein